VDAVETCLMGMIENREEIAGPRRTKRKQKLITLPALTEAKIELYRQIRAASIGKAELARHLHSHLPQIEQALLAVGKRSTISIQDAA
jgi:antitoxin HicB